MPSDEEMAQAAQRVATRFRTLELMEEMIQGAADAAIAEAWWAAEAYANAAWRYHDQLTGAGA